MPSMIRQDDVYILDLGDTENRFNPDWIHSVNTLLDQVENDTGPKSLVTTATGKFYSNGLDLDWMLANEDQAERVLLDAHELLARMLTMPVVTVAAIQGHAFAAGAMFSLAHDFRVMRRDRGYWCLPEADLNLPFTDGMSALIHSRLTPQVAHEAMVTARRYGGYDAAGSAIVDRAAAAEEVRDMAVAWARHEVDKTGDTLRTIKTRLYASVLEALRQPHASPA
ncbi:enoyl-CoA hydratase-related protein [Nonomuraea sp. NPDC004580]|uniref:enoyl-CoA hydratase-related protein n=1 Tax=Nonomuraea sp. NPDC004580 TaxID=3154552 RepID=UPI0033A8A28B